MLDDFYLTKVGERCGGRGGRLEIFRMESVGPSTLGDLDVGPGNAMPCPHALVGD